MLPIIVAALAPLIQNLAANGLNLIGSAVLSKGKEVIEEKLGVKLEDALATDEGKQKLLQLQNDHEEELLKLALENKKIDLDFYKAEAADRDSARDSNTRIQESENASWMAKNIVPILALIIVIGGGSGIIWSPDTDVRIGLAALVSSVITYYFGTSKGADRQATTIQNLSK